MNKISQKRVKKYSAYRFTACLLAVLMLFSALSTGSMTVHAEAEGVARIVGGNTYASLEAAVDAAGTPTEAVEIDLLANTALTQDVTIKDNITLDLNGYTLDLGSNDLNLRTSGKVVDNSDAQTGLLTTSDGEFNSTTQMAVYNTAKSGYVVADVKHQEAILTEASTGEFKLVFKPDFGTAANSLLGSNGTDAKVSIQILLSWDGGSQTFTYTSDMIKDVYANSGRAFYITVTNFTNVANVKATPLIVPSLGTECRGTAHILTGATVAVESVTLDASALELVVGSTATLTATVAPDNATDKTVTWTSSDKAVATVADGVVTGVAAGTATITATTSNGMTATCAVEVKVYTSHKSENFNGIETGILDQGDGSYAMTASLGRKGKLDAFQNAIISTVNVEKDGKTDNIAIELQSNAKANGNALCQIDLDTSFSYKKVKINYSIYVNDIPSIANTSAFPKISNRANNDFAYPIKLTATTDTDGVKTGQIQYLDENGVYQNIQAYSTGAWYDFSLVLDLEKQTYDLYINNQKVLNGVKLVTEKGIDYIRYIVYQINSNDNSTSSILLDDLSVEIPATN